MECIKYIIKFWAIGITSVAAFYVSFNLLYWLGFSNFELIIQTIHH